MVVFDAGIVDQRDLRDLSARTEGRGHRLGQGTDLRVTVAGPSYGFAVHPQTHVVEEDAPVQLPNVDPALDPRDERVDGTGKVTPVDPHVHREVIAGSRGDTDEGEPVSARGRGDGRERAVPTCNAEGICPAGDGFRDQLTEIATVGQDDDIDPQLAGSLRHAGAALFRHRTLG